MCFFKAPKLKEPKTQAITQDEVAPIEDQTPTVEDGTEASAEKKKNSTNQKTPGISLFELALIPGATTTAGDDPGAAANPTGV